MQTERAKRGRKRSGVIEERVVIFFSLSYSKVAIEEIERQVD